jgi:hypothetical protein
MPTNWPFGYAELISLVLLLLISNAWVLLLVPRNWEKFGAISRSFWITITFLAVWWGMIFTAAGWMFAKASESPPLRSLSGVYAAQDLPSLAKTTNRLSASLPPASYRSASPRSGTGEQA